MWDQTIDLGQKLEQKINEGVEKGVMSPLQVPYDGVWSTTPLDRMVWISLRGIRTKVTRTAFEIIHNPIWYRREV